MYDILRNKIQNGVTYTDATLSGYLTANDEDINGAAGEIWADYAGSIVVSNYDFSADNASYKLSQVYEYAREQSKHYLSKRAPTTTLWIKSPEEVDTEDTLQVG